MDVRDAFFDSLVEIAGADPSIIVITDDMGAFGLEEFKRRYPDRYLNPGIAEQNLINVASGLAHGGMRPVVYGIATFMTLRCLEQIRLGLCWPGLPVTIVASGPGYAYAYDGPTHHAVQDVAIVRTLPGITIFNPSEAASTAASARLALTSPGPSYVRLEKGALPALHGESTDFARGFAVSGTGRHVAIVSTGYAVHLASRVAAALAADGIAASVVDVFRLKPVHSADLVGALTDFRQVVVIDEASETGGLASIVAEAAMSEGVALPLKRFSLPDRESDAYGSRDWLLERGGLHVERLRGAIMSPVS